MLLVQAMHEHKLQMGQATVNGVSGQATHMGYSKAKERMADEMSTHNGLNE